MNQSNPRYTGAPRPAQAPSGASGAKPAPAGRSSRAGRAPAKPAAQGKKRGAAKAAQRRAKKRRGVGFILLLLALIVLLAAAGTLLADRVGEKKQSYPVAYEQLIRSYADQNGLAPAHVAAVILAESGYRPEVVSSAGAQGLMQITPSTGEWIARKLDESYSEGCLFDPETNIRYGCWYLGYLMRRYDGDMTCASAAYHSGQGAVDSWLEDPAYSADGKTLQRIKGDRATTYVKRILENYEKYAEIYV